MENENLVEETINEIEVEEEENLTPDPCEEPEEKVEEQVEEEPVEEEAAQEEEPKQAASIERYNIREIPKPQDVTKTPERDPRNDDSRTRALMLKSIQRKKRREFMRKLMAILLVIALLVAAFANRKLLLKIKPIGDAVNKVTNVSEKFVDEGNDRQMEAYDQVTDQAKSAKDALTDSFELAEETEENGQAEVSEQADDLVGGMEIPELAEEALYTYNPLGAFAEFIDKDTPLDDWFRKLTGRSFSLRKYYGDYTRAKKDVTLFGKDTIQEESIKEKTEKDHPKASVDYQKSILETMTLEKVYRKNLKVKARREALIAKSDLLAAGYDYDGALKILTGLYHYEDDQNVLAKVKQWNEVKKDLKEFKAGDVTHIFYHTLVIDTDLAFNDIPGNSNGFKQWMTTKKEFDKITQTMYDKGYVLCSLYDFFEETVGEDGNPKYQEKSVYLPKGKKPFILSLDDLSYYHTYTNHGMATKLVLDEKGKVTCEYVKRDGTTVTGSYDCVPLINDFMEAHPDGAYHGARGTIALTGYNGVFGYRTDESYVDKKDLDEDKAQWLKENPKFDHDKEVAEAKKVADELKAEGWTFASHTWGHIRIGKASYERVKKDTARWMKNVKPIIGDTPIIIFAHGQDISSSDEYDTENNKKYKYLSKKGFHIYLNVDSRKHTMAVHESYVHGGRRNLDGYRLWQDSHKKSDYTSDLFKAKDVIDPDRKDMPKLTD